MDEFSVLYRRHAPDVFRFAMSLCRDREEAEDITSETFVRAWTSPEAIRMATVKGYLFTIARHLFLQRLRRRERQVALGPEPEDPGPGPADRAARSAQLAAVLAAMGELPEVDRTALLLRVVEEMPYEEIARTLGITLAAVKVKIHRARKALLASRER